MSTKATLIIRVDTRSLARMRRLMRGWNAMMAMQVFPSVDCDVDAIAQDVVEGRIMDWRRAQ
ncbi:hypothetical protein SAMN04515647_3677 [Cohaesibacter sp. ES.047]|uniref:hypothetical protein n=1 Tax=Cohaesibacter sp. ES.047 TaxID=1798205 RepID=UPI000BB88746|nr:hypothetical protein [Cohaesibacter sp. ES.047]SNY93382.1 hypothetical protein SAMN04515647_3677 [Cohaesibacter sp. ES.047]